MKLLVILCFGLFLDFTTIVVVNSFEVTGTNFEIDPLGNVYILNHSTISKFDNTGQLLQSYSTEDFTEITSIDVSNPMKIIVYYRHSEQIIFLDNYLSLHEDPIDLYELVDRDIQLVCRSGSSNLWLYDQFYNQIIQLDYSMQLTNATGTLQNLLPDKFTPIMMLEKNEKLFVLSAEQGVAVFDIFGNFLYRISIPPTTSIQIEGDNLLYPLKNSMISYNLITHMEEQVTLPVSPQTTIKKQGKKYYTLEDSFMKIFKEKRE